MGMKTGPKGCLGLNRLWQPDFIHSVTFIEQLPQHRDKVKLQIGPDIKVPIWTIFSMIFLLPRITISFLLTADAIQLPLPQGWD